MQSEDGGRGFAADTVMGSFGSLDSLLDRFNDTELQPIYEAQSQRLVDEFEKTPFWRSFLDELPGFAADYWVTWGLPLLAHPKEDLEVVPKPWLSLLEKCYRKNFLDGPPEHGLITERDWLSRIHDIVRTTVVVRYLDGVRAVCKLLGEAGHRHGFHTSVDWKANEEGYYAAHVAVEATLPYANHAESSLDPPLANVKIEIQVCTQLQQVIRELTHSLYARRRSHPRPPDEVWQWDSTHQEFIPNYLGHILHYADGMIMNVRERVEAQR